MLPTAERIEPRIELHHEHQLLMERVASSRYIGKSTRLRDLLVYLCRRVLEESAQEIHEQEVGCNVFGRPLDYDTTIDNIVRVHASQLRKRLEQYFAAEGAGEPWIIEIPKGNYAPVFRERGSRDRGERERAIREPATPESLLAPLDSSAALRAVAPPDPSATVGIPASPAAADWRIWTLAALALVFASTTAVLLFQSRSAKSSAAAGAAAAATSAYADKPTVRLFWSQIFHQGQQTDIVLDDATVGLYQELVGRQVGITEYFDRSYLRKLEEMASKGRLDAKQAESIVTRRHSTYASSHLLWRLFQAAGPLQNQSTVYFARDYTFRGIKSDNVILLGNSRSNPWVEPFESRLGLRWAFQDKLGIYYPVDTLAKDGDANRFRMPTDPPATPASPNEGREAYCMVALLPNLGGTGKVLIVSGTGGSAVGAAGDFLVDEPSVAHLRSTLPAGTGKNADFPYFEALIRIKSRSALPKDVTVVLSRGLRD